MNNTNIALAYINEMQNPLRVFCNLLIYVLYKDVNNSLRIDEVKDAILKEFGLRVPSHIIKACAKILKKNCEIEILDNGGGYKLLKPSFSIDKFEEQLATRKILEENLITDLHKYLSEMNIELTFSEAQSRFVDFLIDTNYAYALFNDGSTDAIKIDKKGIGNDWYISQYIKKLEREKNSKFDYVLEIVKGLMVYIGLCQFSDYHQEKEEKFCGTSFYLDTKMMLRYLGYSWPELVEETKELVDLIRKEYKGNLCISEHTFEEILSALNNEIYVLENGGNENYELQCFRTLNNYKKEMFEVDRVKLEDKIKEENIEIKNDIDIKTDENIRYNLDYKAFTQYIHANYPKWKENTIYNDVHSINQIHILRRGNYTKSFGGKQKLPIFVTTNYPLITCCRKYLKEEYQKKGKEYNYDNLPVVADSTLMYRLWLPRASKIKENIPALSLSRIVYTAQQENEVFYSKFKNAIRNYSSYKDITLDNVSEIYCSKLFEITAKNTKGEYENFNDEILAQSLEEFITITSNQKDEKINTLNMFIQDMNEEKLKDKEEWINIYTEKFIKERPLVSRFFALLSKSWCLCFGGLIVLFEEYINHFSLRNPSLVILIIIIQILKPIFVKIMKNSFNKKIDIISEYFKKIARDDFKKNYERKSSGKALEYKEKILQSCFEKLKIEK